METAGMGPVPSKGHLIGSRVLHARWTEHDTRGGQLRHEPKR